MSLTRLRVSASLVPAILPFFYVIVAESPDVSQLRVLDWNLAADDVGTVLYEVDGDAGVFADAARATDGISEVVLSRPAGDNQFALVTADPESLPFFRTFLTLTARAGLLVRKPIVYSDFESRGEVVGESEALQAAVDAAPNAVDVTVEEIGSTPSLGADPLDALSQRQREAVLTAFEQEYYAHPRETTHAELASLLNCAPNTVSEHLQKAEAKLVEAVMDQSLSRRSNSE